jgi:AmmeMemoRadiSam system protein B/AmmeMemoRadiSam system protein A
LKPISICFSRRIPSAGGLRDASQAMRIEARLGPIALLLVLTLAACTVRAPSPQPTSPGRIRPAALAGSWYPASSEALAQTVDKLLAAVEPVDGAPIALIVPHAGYAYSGPVAAAGFRQLQQGQYDTAVIIAADHQMPLANPIAVWAEGGFQTPLGLVPVDVELARALVASDPRLTADLAAHEGEHPIEIELPFLQRVCPHCRIVPVLMGQDDETTVQALAAALARLLPGRRAVVIASSDLSHYPAYKDALAVDSATLSAIETGDPAAVRATIARSMAAKVPNLATCACGEGPILVAMRVAQRLGAETVTVLRYANSGDSPQGDKGQVVGYGAVMFWRYQPPHLSPKQRQTLLALARLALSENLRTGRVPGYHTEDPALTRLAGAFVTLKQRGELRGCIGRLRADTPLYRVVPEMAASAATADPRFPPLKIEELSQVEIEIAVLSPLRRVTDPQQIQVGTHGLLIVKGGRQGVLLPQVPIEEGWDRQAFLEGLCSKAGLSAGCWREGASLYAFTAVAFRE